MAIAPRPPRGFVPETNLKLNLSTLAIASLLVK